MAGACLDGNKDRVTGALLQRKAGLVAGYLYGYTGSVRAKARPGRGRPSLAKGFPIQAIQKLDRKDAKK